MNLRNRKSDKRTAREAMKEVRKKSTEGATAVDTFVRRLLEVGISGAGPFRSATAMAERARRKTHSQKRAETRVIRRHVRSARAGGFVTGVGGPISLWVALPANLLSFFTLATRMVAAIAELRGYDTKDPAVRTAVLLTLTGSSSRRVLNTAGFGPISGRVVSQAAKKLPPASLMVVNKAVGVHLVRRFATRGLGRLLRAIPLVGGIVGAVLDARHMKRIAKKALEEFPQR